MLRNYLKIALRNLLKHKGYTFINVFGLAVGIACCVLILLFVRDELSYDRFHEKADRIYRVVFNGYVPDAPPLCRDGPTLCACHP
jgi:putative ABC transport system permease protein